MSRGDPSKLPCACGRTHPVHAMDEVKTKACLTCGYSLPSGPQYGDPDERAREFNRIRAALYENHPGLVVLEEHLRDTGRLDLLTNDERGVLVELQGLRERGPGLELNVVPALAGRDGTVLSWRAVAVWEGNLPVGAAGPERHLVVASALRELATRMERVGAVSRPWAGEAERVEARLSEIALSEIAPAEPLRPETLEFGWRRFNEIPLPGTTPPTRFEVVTTDHAGQSHIHPVEPGGRVELPPGEWRTIQARAVVPEQHAPFSVLLDPPEPSGVPPLPWQTSMGRHDPTLYDVAPPAAQEAMRQMAREVPIDMEAVRRKGHELLDGLHEAALQDPDGAARWLGLGTPPAPPAKKPKRKKKR